MALKTYAELKEEVLNNRACSYWLKDALRAADKKDCVDALYDVKTLLFILTTRVKEATELAYK